MVRCERCGHTVTRMDAQGVLRCSVCGAAVDDGRNIQLEGSYRAARSLAKGFAAVGDYVSACRQAEIMKSVRADEPEVYSLPLDAAITGEAAGILSISGPLLSESRINYSRLKLAGGNVSPYDAYWNRRIRNTIDDINSKTSELRGDLCFIGAFLVFTILMTSLCWLIPGVGIIASAVYLKKSEAVTKLLSMRRERERLTAIEKEPFSQ